MEIDNKPNLKFQDSSIAPMHTAEHILNGTMNRMWGCRRAFSTHIERKKSKCDYKMEKPLNAQQIQQVEDRVNFIISQNIPVTTEFATQEDVKQRFDMGRLPENADETVRIVHIGEYDECLCVGAHVTNTSEIGTFHISSSRYESGIFRIVFRLH